MNIRSRYGIYGWVLGRYFMKFCPVLLSKASSPCNLCVVRLHLCASGDGVITDRYPLGVIIRHDARTIHFRPPGTECVINNTFITR